MRIAGTAVLLAAMTAVTALSLVLLGYHDPKSDGAWMLDVATLLLWALFAVAIWSLRGVRGRAAVVLVMAGSLALGTAAMASPPNTSTDSARYAWDGIVQNAGISPYEYVPADPALRELRPQWLFPAPHADGTGEPSCRGDRVMKFHELDSDEVLCSTINRAAVPTIYPALGEMLFAGVRALVPPDVPYWPLQLLGLLASLGVTAALLRALSASGRDPRWAALWGWCPLIATEAVTNSHLDVVGALLVVLATIAVAGGRRWVGGIALGAAVATKLIPLIAAPALLRKQPWKVLIAAAATFLLLYVPYVLASGIQVLGYLPGYLTEEGYDKGTRFILLSPFLPGLSATVAAALILLVAAVVVWRLSDSADPWLGQLVMIGVTLIVVSPRYPWYALLLVPMIAMTGRWEWLAVTLALSVRLLIPGVATARPALLLAVIIVLVFTVRRASPATRELWRSLARHPVHTLFARAGSYPEKVTER